ncbi:Ets-domain protein [Necator americanus]|uniref:Ets-domain protein n=1 Tax=Necator americanus TaxID=51031 RepID=W2TRT2_NECAM|nr:Ets-domain protein [Necator americanus]ETN83737.1 Ets-domain protein [Necator americanus]
MTTAQTPTAEEQRPSPFPRHSGTVHLWHFIRELLDHPNKQYGSCVRWVDRDEGTFKIESSHHLARFWGQRKNRAQMNYDKLSRSLRQYYKKGLRLSHPLLSLSANECNAKSENDDRVSDFNDHRV